jgi:hypothetical protein
VPVLDYPYVTLDEFRKHPHYLDLDNLLVGDLEALQDSTVVNALLFASSWADTELDMPLGAHIRTENARIRPDRHGRLRYHPEHTPVLKVANIATGAEPNYLDDITSPQVWTEQDGRIVVAYGPGNGAAGIGSIQFGRAPAAGELLTRWTYVAGYPHTQLAADAAQGATSLQVRSTVGMLTASLATTATTLRLWTPGFEEAVTVAAVTGLTSVTLTSPLQHSHTVGMSCSAIPPDARMAVIKMACAKLLRKGPLAEQAGRTQRGPSPHASAGDPKRTTASGNYQQHACGLLASYKRVR